MWKYQSWVQLKTWFIVVPFVSSATSSPWILQEDYDCAMDLVSSQSSNKEPCYVGYSCLTDYKRILESSSSTFTLHRKSKRYEIFLITSFSRRSSLGVFRLNLVAPDLMCFQARFLSRQRVDFVTLWCRIMFLCCCTGGCQDDQVGWAFSSLAKQILLISLCFTIGNVKS